MLATSQAEHEKKQNISHPKFEEESKLYVLQCFYDDLMAM